MKINRKGSAIILILFVLSLVGCANMGVPEEHRGAAVGAGVGGLAGAAIGGDSPRGAIIGGLVGALIGGAVGHYGYDQRRDYQETTQAYETYEPGTGTRLYIEEVETSPQTVEPGGTVDLRATYALLTPTGDAEVPITEIRKITHNGEVVGNPRVNVDRTGGTYTSTVPLQLPGNADPGVYTITTTVETTGASDARETTFIVG
ncbi:MAG: YMGG-like glycine zipper-containing protein [Desulfobacterales bacterium]